MMASEVPPPHDPGTSDAEPAAERPPGHAHSSEPAARPPVIPPPFPPPLPSGQPSTPLLHGRLHPLTLLFNAWGLARGLVVPAVIALVVGNKTVTGGILIIFLVIPLVLAVIRYFTFTYRIEHGELITAHGLFGRVERNIPLARVQDIRIEQGLLHRLLNMTDVNIETAGGRGAEASLSVLSRTEAERLRAAVFEQVSRARQTPGAATALVAPAQPREVIRNLTIRDLILAGLTSNQMASVLALLALAFSVVDDVLPPETYQRFSIELGRFLEQFAQQGVQTAWIQIVAAIVMLLLVGLFFSVVGSIVMFYGFTLSRSGEDLHRSYGLLTRRASSLPRKRIQVLKIEEKLLRRFFGLAAVRADTAGSRPQQQDGATGHDVLLPIVPRSQLDPILPVFFPDVETGSGEWRRVSRRAIRRGTAKGTLVCVLLAGVLWLLKPSWMDLWPMALIPFVFLLNVMSYRHLGYWLGEKFFWTRRGWLSRATHIVPIRNAQCIVLRQTPFDRRHGVGTLLVDTAGQVHTGGGPKIDNVAWSEAIVVARTLAHRAAETRYRWQRS